MVLDFGRVTNPTGPEPLSVQWARDPAKHDPQCGFGELGRMPAPQAHDSGTTGIRPGLGPSSAATSTAQPYHSVG